jgi:ABC-2 type transport system permease protein
MAWASPIEAQRVSNRRIVPLLWSSRKSWLSDNLEVMPSLDADGSPVFPDADNSRQSSTLGLMMRGRFESYFTGRANPLSAIAPDEPGTGPDRSVYPGTLLHSAESARIVLFASNDFMDDQVLNAIVAATGTQYLGPLELFMNTLDWALQDEQLLQIRSAGHFNRTLPPMEPKAQALLEYINYGLAMLWLALLAGLHWLLKYLRRRRYARGLAL